MQMAKLEDQRTKIEQRLVNARTDVQEKENEAESLIDENNRQRKRYEAIEQFNAEL